MKVNSLSNYDMKYNSVVNFQSKKIENNPKNPEIKGQDQKKDPLSNYPLRLCAYTNEVGAALAPIPNIGATLFKLSWVPALLYFGADVYDKYAKGNNKDYAQASSSEALKQTIFQGLASVILPTMAVIAGQNILGDASKHFNKDKMTVGQKEDVLNELKRDINQDNLRKYKGEINQIINDNPNLSLEEVKKTEKITEIKKNLTDKIFAEISTETETARRKYQDKGILKKFFGYFSHGGHDDFANVAKIKADKFEQIVKPYLKKHISELVDTRVELQSIMDKDGGIHPVKRRQVSKELVKKAQKLLEKNIDNRDIVDKTSYVIKECILGKITKTAMKLSAIKIAGGFAALTAFAIPIDHFVEKVIIKKVVDPGIDMFENRVSDFSQKSKQKIQGEKKLEVLKQAKSEPKAKAEPQTQIKQTPQEESAKIVQSEDATKTQEPVISDIDVMQKIK